ncbi:MAG: helix-hairpin-helix domain-containing protein [Planctomycetota bacterium]
MWLILIATVMLVGFNRAVQVDSATAAGVLETTRARWAARAGVEQAKHVLSLDSRLSDDTYDDWYESALDFQNVELAHGSTFRVVAGDDNNTLRYGLDDASSRLNVNHANQSQLAELPDIDVTGVDAILDWRDDNEAVRPGGAERGFYTGLDFPYDIRNGLMHTHREMLLIDGIGPAEFYGEDLNADGLLSIGENDGPDLPPDDNADDTLDPGLHRYTTVYSYVNNAGIGALAPVNLTDTNNAELIQRFNFTPELAEEVRDRGRQNPDNLFEFNGLSGGTGRADSNGVDEVISRIDIEWLANHWEQLTLAEDPRLPGKININTASREVLMTIPDMEDAVADQLIAQRSSGTPMTSVGQLFTGGMLDERQFRRVAPYVTVRSNVFRVLSEGRSGLAVVRIEAVLDRGAGLAVRYWREDGL